MGKQESKPGGLKLVHDSAPVRRAVVLVGGRRPGIAARSPVFRSIPMSMRGKSSSPSATRVSLRNVLIFHSGALGDFILTWPLARALGRLYPQSRIIYVTSKDKGKLAEELLHIEAVDVETGGWHLLHRDGVGLPENSTKLMAEAHSIFTFSATADEAWTKSAMRLAPRAGVCTIAPALADLAGVHAAEYLIGQLGDMPAVQQGTAQILKSLHERGLGKPAASGPIAIHPGSGSVSKCWPTENFRELAMRLRGRGREMRIILGEVERERWTDADQMFGGCGEVVWCESYLDLMRGLAECRAFIGNDSGPGHLAGMMGMPTLCVYGPTAPEVWRPIGPAVHVRRHEPLAELSVDAVEAWIAEEGASHGVLPA